MLIGGYALPFYGAIRATIGIDIAVEIAIKEQFDTLIEKAIDFGFRPQIYSFLNPLCLLLDDKTGLEIELWMRIDGVDWDAETLKRRQKQKLDEFEFWVISPEDFIVNKLARSDRSVQDEKDVKSVLVRCLDTLDRKYLEQKAKKAGVMSLLEVIEKT